MEKSRKEQFPREWGIKERASLGSDPSLVTCKMELGRVRGQGPKERSSLTNAQKKELDVSLAGLISPPSFHPTVTPPRNQVVS